MTDGSNQPTTKKALLERIRRDRERFDAIVDRVPPHRLEEQGLAAEGWSVRDVLYHVAWGDRQNAGVIRGRALAGSPLWQVSEDERNAAVVREGRALSLDEVLREYRDSYSEFVAGLETLTDRELNDRDGWRGLKEAIPGWLPWRVMYDPGHYEAHGRWIEEGLARAKR